MSEIPRNFAWLRLLLAEKKLAGHRFTGEFVALREGEFVTDQVSGTTYCTQAAWNALRAKIDSPEPYTPSPANPAANTGDLA